ncbi:MFS transporter [Agromyces sp. ZXT2-6]|uniref:MFS transporter n=1 Tax=Agromyces sp. ZXT2-6 TaxID=3461153 RepID=UPI004054B375
MRGSERAGRDRRPSAGSRRHETRWIVAALCTGTILSALNSGMVAVALSTLRRAFAVDVATVTWVISAFYLTSAVLQPLMGRLADRYGPRRVFAFGMVTIIVAGALGPFAPNLVLLCAVRVLLAVGTAAAFPSAAAMLRAISATEGGDGRRLIARVQLIDTSAAAVGPVFGGLLIVGFGWEAIFWINVPLAALALASTWLLAPADPPRQRVPLRATLRESDIPGVLLFVATVVGVLLFVLELPDGPSWPLLAAAIVAGALFAWRELRTATPFIDLRLLARDVPLLRVYALFVLANLVFYSALFGLPQYLEEHAGYRTDVVGLLLLPLAAFNVAMAPLAERLIDRRGLRTTLVVGTAALAAGTMLLPLLAATTSPVAVLAATAAIGIPYVLVLVSITQSLTAASPPGHAGQAAGLFQTARSLGSTAAGVVVALSFTGGTDPAEWSLLAAITAGLAIVTLVVAVAWRDRRAASPGR